ncbi:MAG: biotin transporter BioY [Chloroflexota bacterium]|nr:biotin transporter BioY [Chloroflexota bacterium]
MLAANTLAPRRTWADVALPGRGVAYQVMLVVLGSLLVALSARVVIPLPWTPVPITGQTYGVLLVGATLGSRRGALSMLLYLLEGGAGLPFFAGGASGWGRVFGPSGGYLLGYVLAAYMVGWLAERGWDRRFGTCLLAMLAGEVAIYLIGLPWLAVFVGTDRVLGLGLLPFAPGDTLKLLLAAASLPMAWRVVGRDDPGPSLERR